MPAPQLLFLFLEAFKANSSYYVTLPQVLQYEFLIEKDSLRINYHFITIADVVVYSFKS